MRPEAETGLSILGICGSGDYVAVGISWSMFPMYLARSCGPSRLSSCCTGPLSCHVICVSPVQPQHSLEIAVSVGSHSTPCVTCGQRSKLNSTRRHDHSAFLSHSTRLTTYYTTSEAYKAIQTPPPFALLLVDAIETRSARWVCLPLLARSLVNER